MSRFLMKLDRIVIIILPLIYSTFSFQFNTFQVILTSDGNTYYVIIAFIEMQYPPRFNFPSPKVQANEDFY